MEKAKSLDYFKLKLLRGGLDAWKAKGYPLERIEEAFRFDTPA